MECITGAGSIQCQENKQAGADLQRTEQGGDTEVIGLGSPNLMELYNLIGDYHKDQGQAAQEPREQRHIF